MRTIPRGGEWLIEAADPAALLTPERLSEEHRLIRQAVEEFITRDVLPVLDRLEARDWALARSLVEGCGHRGFLGADVPESLGGADLDSAAALVIGEAAGRCASFSATFGAQTGLAITPLLCFGTEDQKRRYIPRLVAGELIGAYALSESGSGSDALNARTRAVRQPDGSFRLHGEKMWITNGGFADLFVVFAKVTDSASEAAEGRFTAFLVERTFSGVSTGQEEHKMGLHGSSTTPLLLQDAAVRAENLLGEIGQGHKVAFNVLNYGRWKLAAMCSGGARHVIAEAAAYATARRQFGRAIASFGAIRHKLAEMTIRQYVLESMLYRTVGLLDAMQQGTGPEGRRPAAALEELAIEASILKVAGSEMLDFVVDENVQIHGGNGFVSGYPAERHYRDARVNRIFEGTNEINRLLIPGLLAKRTTQGALPLLAAARQLRSAASEPSPAAGLPLEMARATVARMKEVALMVFATALECYGASLPEEQEVLTRAADILIETYGCDSAVLRAFASASTPLHEAAACVAVNDAAVRVQAAACDVMARAASDDQRQPLCTRIRRLLDTPPLDTIALRRLLGDAVVERRVYPF